MSSKPVRRNFVKYVERNKFTRYKFKVNIMTYLRKVNKLLKNIIYQKRNVTFYSCAEKILHLLFIFDTFLGSVMNITITLLRYFEGT